MNITKVTLTNIHDEIINEFRYDQGFSIHIEFAISENIKNSSIWVSIRNMDDILLFTTADTDVAEDLLESRKPGHYHKIITIPPKWLNAGRYYVIVGAVKNMPLEVYERVETVSFTILDIGTPENLRTGQSRVGLLQPFIEWKQVAIPN